MNASPMQWLPVDHDPFAGPALEAYAPVTQAQSELWLASALDPSANLAYNEGIGLWLRGPLQLPALRQALQTVTERHESLRATFSPDGRWMCVRESLPLELPLSLLEDSQGAAAQLQAQTRELMAQPFDLERGPLLRCALFRTAPEEHRLLLVAHHIVCDGWSMAQLLVEIGALYSAAVEGRTAALAPPDRYTEYAELEQRFLQSPQGRAQLQWWIERLRDAQPPLLLPCDRPPPPQRRFDAGRYDHLLPQTLAATLRRLSAAQGNSLVMTLVAALAAQLQRLGCGEDLVIGLAAAGQALYERPKLVGHCVNFLPLRLQPQPAASVAALLQHTRAAVLDAFEHQDVTYGALLPQLALPRDEARPPLISVAFNLDQRDDDIGHRGLQVSYQTLARLSDSFELYLNVIDNGRDLVVECSYSLALFDEDTIRRRLHEYETVLAGLEDGLQAPLQALPLLDAGERERLLHDFDGGTLPLPETPLHELITAVARSRPDDVAVECGAQRRSYAELMTRSESIAAALAAAGVQGGDFVGVCLRRSVDLPAALLAVLHCGAAYVPLDPEVPPARLQFMLEDAGARLLLCEAATAPLLQAPAILQLEQVGSGRHRPRPVAPDAAAYAIYTSGSTGTPKGVVAHHRGLVNCLLGTRQRIPLGGQDALLALATCAFDASVLEFFLPLLCGARLVIASEEQATDGRLLAEAIERHGITRIFTAPAAWRLLLAAGWAGKADLIGVSWAEPLTPELAQALQPRLSQLWNLYGPTETTVWTLGQRIDDAAAAITIGTPIPNTHVCVLDAGGQPVPLGVTGELCIGGVGVARGYLQRPELEAERFVADPWSEGGAGRLYRTGDLARCTAGGEIVCLGRADHQVKLRGFRIELGEIEARLRALPEVAEAVCGLRERSPGDPRLVAWVQPAPAATTSAGELRSALRALLPAYMLPQHYLLVEALPRLPNGKLDRQSLPDPFHPDAMAAAPERLAPRDEAEQRMAQLWTEVLGHAEFGIADHFLDVGGHSLLAAQLASRLRGESGLRLPLRQIMTGTLAQLAKLAQAGPTRGTAAAREPAGRLAG